MGGQPFDRVLDARLGYCLGRVDARLHARMTGLSDGDLRFN